MHNKRVSLLIALLLAGLLSGQVAAQTTSNLKREKNWADQVVDTVVVGEPVWLSARRHKFLALYAPPAQTGSRGVILLHGRGVHPPGDSSTICAPISPMPVSTPCRYRCPFWRPGPR